METIPLKQLQELTYCIDQVDERTGQAGVFAYDTTLHSQHLGYWAISPVFDRVTDMVRWADSEGFRYLSVNTRKYTLCRVPPKISSDKLS